MIVIPAKEKDLITTNNEAPKCDLSKEHINNVAKNEVDFNSLLQQVMTTEGAEFSFDSTTAQLIIHRGPSQVPLRFVKFISGSETLKEIYTGMGFVEDPDFSRAMAAMAE